MKILISGATGLIGTALTTYFTDHGHEVIPLVRGKQKGLFSWQPERGLIFLDNSVDLDVVINLAGPSIADKRWNQERKGELLESRVSATSLLAAALAKRTQKPALFLSASAIGFYGPRGDETVDESSDSGGGFLAELARQWEMATKPAEAAGIRTVHLRTGIVLSSAGGALQQMLLPFKLGLGGLIGNGGQYMSWVSINELPAMIEFIIDHSEIGGPVNLVSTQPVTNREFTKSLGSVLGRPTLIPMPAFLARLLFGEMADELLLSGAKVTPQKLIDAGYLFKENSLKNSLLELLH